MDKEHGPADKPPIDDTEADSAPQGSRRPVVRVVAFMPTVLGRVHWDNGPVDGDLVADAPAPDTEDDRG